MGRGREKERERGGGGEETARREREEEGELPKREREREPLPRIRRDMQSRGGSFNFSIGLKGQSAIQGSSPGLMLPKGGVNTALQVTTRYTGHDRVCGFLFRFFSFLFSISAIVPSSLRQASKLWSFTNTW